MNFVELHLRNATGLFPVSFLVSSHPIMSVFSLTHSRKGY